MAKSILIQNGTILDPDQAIHEQLDIRVRDGKIAELGSRLQTYEGEETIDAVQKLIIPGMIDLHTHVYGGIGVNVDAAGVYVGVTTLVDAGSAGASTVPDLLALTEQAKTSVYAIIFAESPGAVDFQVHTNPGELGSLHITKIAELMEKYPDKLLGFKSAALSDLGLPWVRMTKALSQWFQKPAYYHIGNFRKNTLREPCIRGMLGMLEKGDIITHCYTIEEGGLLDEQGNPYPELFEALERGIHLDLGHGGTGFSYAVGSKMLELGIKPHSLSSDINISNFRRINLPGVMSKVMALGIPLEEIVAMVTINPARAIGIEDQAGTLRVGYPADIAILELKRGRFDLTDTEGETRIADMEFRPWKTLKNGELFDADEDRVKMPGNHQFQIDKVNVPEAALNLNFEQRVYLSVLYEFIQQTINILWDPDTLQAAIHGIAQRQNLPLRSALQAIYACFSEQIENGPQAGWFLHKQKQPFLLQRLQEVIGVRT